MSTRIYIGPSIAGLNSGTIFLGEFPAHIEALLSDLPHVRALIVPIEGLQQSKSALLQKGTVLNFHLQHLLQKEP